RGDLSVERLLVINQAFDAIDESKDGDISIAEIKKRYNCKNHPAILDRSATREQVVKEFLGQWDKARSDGTIDRSDFTDFYHDVSSAISDDEDFEYMMEDTWGYEIVRYDEDGDEVKKFSEEASLAVSNSVPSDPYQDDVKEVCGLIFSPPCDFSGLIVRLGASQVSACPSLTLPQFASALSSSARRSGGSLSARRAAELVDSVLQSVQKGGSMIDTLTKQELKNGLADWGLPLNIREVDAIFTFFDRDNSGLISFDEFLKGLRGPMSGRRKDLVNQAFDVVDKTGDGRVTVEDLKGVYDCSGHPGVVDGSMTEEDVLSHFVDTWDQGEKDGVVTREEFMDYYADVGASIDGDEYFELMIRNAWHIAGGEGAGENSANKKVMCLFG
ncbi:hypothetical protein TrRE_jg9014, partial [Triparma retinervis]